MSFKKPFFHSCLLLVFCLLFASCSISTEEDPDPKTLDFTGRERIEEDNSFDATNGVEVNSDNTSNNRDEQRIQVNKTENPTRIINSQTKITLEEITADQVALLDGVDKTIILETDNNAYVAVKLKGKSSTIHDDLRKKITQVVQTNVQHADAVYISAHPNFYQRMNEYAQAIKTDKATSDFLHDFAETIRRIFPDAR